MNTETNNALIAEFMEGKTIGSMYGNVPQYDSNWSWLMPVVEKIESLFGESVQFIIKDTRSHITQGTQYSVANNFEDEIPECYSGFANSKIDAVYKTVVEFITWYNPKQIAMSDKNKYPIAKQGIYNVSPQSKTGLKIGDIIELPSDMSITANGMKKLPYKLKKYVVFELYKREEHNSRELIDRIVLQPFKNKKIHFDQMLENVKLKLEIIKNPQQ